MFFNLEEPNEGQMALESKGERNGGPLLPVGFMRLAALGTTLTSTHTTLYLHVSERLPRKSQGWSVDLASGSYPGERNTGTQPVPTCGSRCWKCDCHPTSLRST